MYQYLTWMTLLSAEISGAVASRQIGADAAHWPQFRGPSGQGVAREGMKLPTEIGPDKNVLWQTPLPRGHSSPVMWGERIYITGGDKKTKKLETICLDRKSGKVLWRKELVGRIQEQLHQLNGPATATPATDGQHVIVYFGSYGLVCYDRDGNQKWDKPIMPIPGVFGTGSSPVLAERFVLFNSGDQVGNFSLLALDKTSGETVWQKNRVRGISTGVWSSPAVRAHPGGHEVIVMGGLKVAAYNLADGAERWNVTGLPPISLNTPALGDGLVCFTLTNPIGDANNVIKLARFEEALKQYDTNKDGKIDIEEIPKDLNTFGRGRDDKIGEWNPLRPMLSYFDKNKDKALDKAEWEALTKYFDDIGSKLDQATVCIRLEGNGEVSPKNIAWKQTKQVPEVPSPLLYEDRIYLVSERGFLTCRDAKTGKEFYCERLDIRGKCYASPVAGDGKVYVACDRGKLLVLKAGDSFDVLSTADFGESITATPALVDGKIYLRTQKQLFAFGSR